MVQTCRHTHILSRPTVLLGHKSTTVIVNIILILIKTLPYEMTFNVPRVKQH